MLKDGHQMFSGLDEAVLKNIDACKQLSLLTKTSMGPNGDPRPSRHGRPSRDSHLGDDPVPGTLSCFLLASFLQSEIASETRCAAGARDTLA